MSVNQISIFLENRTGQISEITRLLADNQINLRAISIAETADYGVLRLIADDSQKATAILKEQGYIVSLNAVTVVAVPDKPAGLSELLSLLAEDKVDIEYMYSLFTHKDGNAYIVFRIKDERCFETLLNNHGLVTVSAEELGIK